MVQWRRVVGYEGSFYEVSSTGLVRSMDRTVDTRPGVPTHMKGRVIKPSITPQGYRRVQLCREGLKRYRFVHRLVADAFIGPRPRGLIVRHIDGNPGNNHADNLMYGTHSENVLDSVDHGTHYEASKTHCDRGHEYSPENTRYIVRDGKRECITCRRASNRRASARYAAKRRGGVA